MALTEELVAHFNRMDTAQQQRLLNFARILANTPHIQGEPGSEIVQDTGYFDAQSLDEMEAAINAETEDIDWHGWQ